MSHKKTSRKTPSKFAILSHVKPSDFKFITWLMSFYLRFDLPRHCSLKFFKQFQYVQKNSHFELMLLLWGEYIKDKETMCQTMFQETVWQSEH